MEGLASEDSNNRNKHNAIHPSSAPRAKLYDYTGRRKRATDTTSVTCLRLLWTLPLVACIHSRGPPSGFQLAIFMISSTGVPATDLPRGPVLGGMHACFTVVVHQPPATRYCTNRQPRGIAIVLRKHPSPQQQLVTNEQCYP